MKEVGGTETQLGREIDHGHCGGEGDTVLEKGQRQTNTNTQGSTRGKQIPIAIGLESERC